jgi:hypothetical protein
MKTASNLTVLAVIFLVIAMVSSCKKNPVGPQVTPNVQLSVDYVTCTEVWLKLAFADSPDGGDYRITRDGATILTGTISGASAVLYDTTAQAKKNYTYTAYGLSSGQVKQVSPPLSVTTLDSTSHNFTWQTFDFGGDAGSCLLRDVAIINDTLIYAVGAVYLKDSIWQTTYSPNNLLTWNGKNWSPSRIYFYAICGQSYMSSDPINGILPLSPKDVWIAGAGEIARWNGTSQSEPMCVVSPMSFGINRIWGSDTTSVYAVGDVGNIAQYDGRTWRSLTSGTSLAIQDIWGVVDARTGQSQALAVACNTFTTNGIAVLQLSGNTVISVQTAGLPLNVSGVWSASGKEWYVCGDVMCKTKSLNSAWQKIPDLPFIYQECIRGTGPNDIFVVGDFGLVSHFNGSTWYTYPTQPGERIYYGLAMKGDLLVAVGGITTGGVGGAATILMGRRN